MTSTADPRRDQYAALLAENERLRDRVRASDTKLNVYAYWVLRIHRGDRDAVSLAERCLRDIAQAEELYASDEQIQSPPRTRPPAPPTYYEYVENGRHVEFDGTPAERVDHFFDGIGWHPPLALL